MSLVRQVHAQLAEVGNQVSHTLAATAESEASLEEAWYTLRGVGAAPESELGMAVTQLEVAYAALAEARTLLDSYPDLINPYLARIGMPALSSVITPAPETTEEVVAKVRKKPGPRPKTRPPEELPPDKYRARMRAYEGCFAAIRDELSAGQDPRTIDGYIGSGEEYHVFDNGDGTVIKVPRDDRFPHVFPEYERHLSETVKGRHNFEQILGFTTEQGGAFLAARVPGSALENMTSEELDAVPNRHYTALAKAIGFIVGRGLSVEYHSTKTIYNEENGFVFIDNAVGNTPSDSQHDIDTEARMVLVMFGLGETDQKTGAIERFKQAYIRVYPTSQLRYDWEWRSLGA